MHKYNAKATEIDGIRFDSRKEAEKYQELKLLQRAGEIKNIELQPKFLLQEAFKRNGKKYRAITYTADFRVTWKDGTVEVIDTKGYRTQVYRLKKKLFLAKYDVKFTEE